MCEHACQLQVSQLRERWLDEGIFKKDKGLKCTHCHATGEAMLWLCLFCEHIGCGRYAEHQHSLKHYHATRQLEEEGHMLVMNLSERTIWCYACDHPWNLTTLETSSHSHLEMMAFLKELSILIDEEADGAPEEESPRRSATTLSEDAMSSSEASFIRYGPRHGVVGLQNLGNTCYINATLQALSHCEPLTYFFQECPAFIEATKRTTQAHRLSDAYCQLIELLWKGEGDSVNPIGLVRHIKQALPHFRGFGQHDAQELLRCFLDRLHEELKMASGSVEALSKEDRDPAADTNPNPSERPARREDGSHANRVFQSFISDLFEGTLKSRVRCVHCHHESIKEDPFFDLSISIARKLAKSKSWGHGLSSSSVEGGPAETKSPGLLSTMTQSMLSLLGLSTRSMKLQECLHNFCSEEELTGTDQYKCEKCNALHDCTKSIRITRLPEILCIHLKRFRYDSLFSNKIGTPVNFPLVDLDMSPYCIDTKDLGHTRYHLFAIIHHRGGLHGGHYVSYAKNPVDHGWYEFDDSVVTQKTEADIAQVEAYVLFYRRSRSRSEELEHQRILSLIQSPLPPGQPTCLVSKGWLAQWLFSACPGPIRHRWCVCEHRGVNPHRFRHVSDLMQRVPEAVYRSWRDNYGADQDEILRDLLPCQKCDDYETALSLRRRLEEKEVAALDVTTLPRGHFWYLIHSEWLRSWHDFKHDGPLPGPISNHALLDDDTSQPLKHLRKASHYRGVCQQVWDYFHQRYGGGPPIIRTTIDIYAPPPPDSPSPVLASQEKEENL